MFAHWVNTLFGFYAYLKMRSEQQCGEEECDELHPYANVVVFAENSCCFVKIISLKNGNFDLALRKRLFCDAKPTLLPCKTAAFGMQNNRFCKTLMYKLLCKILALEKYLQLYYLLFAYKIKYTTCFLQFTTTPLH